MRPCVFRDFLLPGVGGLSLWLSVAGAAGASPLPSVAAVHRLFAAPPREYSTGPLWVWNDWLTEEQVRQTLRDLAGQGIRQAFVHPRPGLMTPYLEGDWFRLWATALAEAERLDMNLWIYDENSYPSGFAGGWVPEAMPESRGLGLVFRETSERPVVSDDVVAVYRLDGTRAEDVTERVRQGEAPKGERWLVARVERAGNSPWHGGRSYVNLLTPGVTEAFLRLTFGGYDRVAGRHYGRRVPGVFTDEPHVQPAGGWPWTADLPGVFAERRGYDLRPHLVSLHLPVGDWRRVRHDYVRTVHELFVERWARPYFEACEARGLELTGHYWEHEWPRALLTPDNMAMAAWQHRPGIDILMNQYAEHTHAQFGNVRSVREVASVARQMGRARSLVEVYGASGWDLRLVDMKRIGDWLLALGVNTLNEHLSYVTIRGARKADHPPSFSYHAPWWPAYHSLTHYFARLCAALTQGESPASILVLEPTTTAWMYQGDAARLQALGDGFFDLLLRLEASQVEYDFGSEDVLARVAAVQGPRLRVGAALYDLVVIPPGTETLTRTTWELLTRYALAGGRVWCASTNLECCDAVPGQGPQRIARGAAGWRQIGAAELVENLVTHQLRQATTVVAREAGDRGKLFHHRRLLEDGELLFLVNTSAEHDSRGQVLSRYGAVEVWDPQSGQRHAFPRRRVQGWWVTDFELPPCGSLLLSLSDRAVASHVTAQESGVALPPEGPMVVRRLDPNVLKLDFVTVTAGGETRSNVYVWEAAQFVFRQHGFAGNPWDSAVQFRDETLRRTFAADSGFEATYEFEIAGPVPPDLALVVERPDLYEVDCNGQRLEPDPGRWWLDRAFGWLPLKHAARSGRNLVRLRARPFSLWHELESVYVVGGFALEAGARGFCIVPDRPLQPGRLRSPGRVSVQPDGTMWLSAGIGYLSGRSDPAPWVEFDLGGEPRAVDRIRIWNYAEAHVRDLTGRGVRDFRIRASTRRDGVWDVDAGRWELERGDAAQELEVRLPPVRSVRFEILRNHQGVEYPAGADAPDHAFVGLAEVQFLDRTGRPMEVRVAGVSSELLPHRRLARHLVDGSGLEPDALGWNDQGHPFYGGRVAYGQVYRVESRRGRFELCLPEWNGSVAEVRVNGRLAGYVWSPPWTCDVTRVLRSGSNWVEVVVYGTLKNTLGPHHGRPALGTAWPGMFRTAPKEGPPPGREYHTVAYGLFGPLELRQRAERSPRGGSAQKVLSGG
jgi:hypothetical protein